MAQTFAAYCPISLGLQTTKSRSYLLTLGPKVGTVCMLGALGLVWANDAFATSTKHEEEVGRYFWLSLCLPSQPKALNVECGLGKAGRLRHLVFVQTPQALT